MEATEVGEGEEEIQINKTRNERGDVPTGALELQRIIRACYE